MVNNHRSLIFCNFIIVTKRGNMGYYIGIALIGIFAGYIAGRLVKGRGFGLIVNLILGIGGAFLGSFLFGLFNISMVDGLLGSLITATLGAVVLLWLVNLIRG